MRPIIFLLSLLLVFACGKESQIVPGAPTGGGSGNPSTSDWAIPQDEVRDGGPGKDGIPSVDNPELSPVVQIDYMNDDDLILGFKVGNDVRGYTHPVLDWHEIINDNMADKSIAITYCPLTGTGIGWNRTFNGQTTTFGVSGLLYNSNLIPYDRRTESNWSQMRLDCVQGASRGTVAETYQLFETSWKTWKKMFPDSKVINTNTGFNRNYGRYPYGNYKTSNEFLLFGVNPDDSRLPRKERVLGIISEDTSAKAYRFEAFKEGVTIMQDNFNGKEYVIVGSQPDNFMMAFERKLTDGTLLEFSALTEGTSTVMSDNEGNKWNVFGEAVDGPRTGEKLVATNSYIGYWFAWGAFYPGLSIKNM